MVCVVGGGDERAGGGRRRAAEGSSGGGAATCVRTDHTGTVRTLHINNSDNKFTNRNTLWFHVCFQRRMNLFIHTVHKIISLQCVRSLLFYHLFF